MMRGAAQSAETKTARARKRCGHRKNFCHTGGSYGYATDSCHCLCGRSHCLHDSARAQGRQRRGVLRLRQRQGSLALRLLTRKSGMRGGREARKLIPYGAIVMHGKRGYLGAVLPRLSRSRLSCMRKRPVTDRGSATMASGVPAETIRPPFSPPPGPMSST